MLWTLCIICSILLAPPNGALADVDQDIVAPRSVESVQAVLDDVTQLMEKIEDGRDHTVSSSALDLLTREVEGLTMELQRLEELTNLLLEKQSKVDDLIRTANSQQLEALMLRLNETLEKETKLREFERQEPKQSKRRPRPVVDVDTQSPVTSASLHRRIGIEAILDHSELEMKNWIVQVIQDELATLKDEFMPPFDVDAVSGGTVGNNSGNCPSTIHVVQKVQQALKDYANDGIGRVDHAQGAQVVHWWTSTTFSPPALSSETLGSVWWRKFIPEDWEKLLPDGWENWRLSIPSYLYHSLVRVESDSGECCFDTILGVVCLTPLVMFLMSTIGFLEWTVGTTRNHSSKKYSSRCLLAHVRNEWPSDAQTRIPCRCGSRVD